MAKRTLLYPGSFDPPTLGHYDIMKRGLKLADRVIVGVHGGSLSKRHWFSPEERIDLFESYFSPEESAKIELCVYDGLTADLAIEKGAQGILRGLRTASDFEFEFSMAAMNKHLAPGVETIFIRTDENLAHISSSLSKDVLRYRNVPGMVSELVANKIRERLEELGS